MIQLMKIVMYIIGILCTIYVYKSIIITYSKIFYIDFNTNKEKEHDDGVEFDDR